MADGEIIIRIVNDEGSGSSDTSGTTVQNENNSRAKSTSKTEQAIFTTLLQHAAKEIKNIAIDEALYQQNFYYQMTDNYMMQQNMSIAKNMIGKAVGYGIMLSAGPAGWVAAGLTAVGDILSIVHNYQQQDYQIRKMDTSLQFNRQRAGYSLTVGAQGENR